MTETLARVLSELEYRDLLPAGHLAVLCVGSVARGWANASSDYDFNVIVRELWSPEHALTTAVPLRPDVVPGVGVYVEGRRWELKYWAEVQVDQMAEKVTWDAFENGASTPNVLTDVEELFLERLVTCLPLAGAEWVDARRRQLERGAFRAWVTTRSLARADGSAEDALGQLAANDVESAVLSARLALGCTVDALLESHGSFGSRLAKWRARRFREVSPKALTFDEYWGLETMRDYGPAAPATWVNQVIDRCKSLAMEVEVQ